MYTRPPLPTRHPAALIVSTDQPAPPARTAQPLSPSGYAVAHRPWPPSLHASRRRLGHCRRLAPPVGVVFILTVMRCISYHVAFGCIHCIRDALHIFRNAYECITHAYTCIHTVHCMHFQTALQHTTAYGYIRCAAYDCIRKGVLHTLHTRRIQRFQKCSVCVSYAVYAAECNMVRNAAHHGKKVYLCRPL